MQRYESNSDSTKNSQDFGRDSRQSNDRCGQFNSDNNDYDEDFEEDYNEDEHDADQRRSTWGRKQ